MLKIADSSTEGKSLKDELNEALKSNEETAKEMKEKLNETISAVDSDTKKRFEAVEQVK